MGLKSMVKTMGIFDKFFGKRVSSNCLLLILVGMGKRIMATLDKVNAKVSSIGTAVAKVDADLDTVRELVASLKEKEGEVTQADLDQLDAALGEIETNLGSVTTEVEGIGSDTTTSAPAADETANGDAGVDAPAKAKHDY